MQTASPYRLIANNSKNHQHLWSCCRWTQTVTVCLEESVHFSSDSFVVLLKCLHCLSSSLFGYWSSNDCKIFMKFSNLPLNLRCREQRRAHLRNYHLLSAVLFSASSKRALVDGNAMQSWLSKGHLDLEVDGMLLLFFTLCYQSPCAWFFYNCIFCLNFWSFLC